MIRFMILATLAATGCAAGTQPPELVPLTPQTPATPAQFPPPLTQPMNEELQSIVREALADAARRTQREESVLKVVSAEAVTWAEGSLGCPTPGGMYTMALVPGYRIVIAAGAERLQYHASRRGEVIHCPPGRAQEPRRDERM